MPNILIQPLIRLFGWSASDLSQYGDQPAADVAGADANAHPHLPSEQTGAAGLDARSGMPVAHVAASNLQPTQPAGGLASAPAAVMSGGAHPVAVHSFVTETGAGALAPVYAFAPASVLTAHGSSGSAVNFAPPPDVAHAAPESGEPSAIPAAADGHGIATASSAAIAAALAETVDHLPSSGGGAIDAVASPVAEVVAPLAGAAAPIVSDSVHVLSEVTNVAAPLAEDAAHLIEAVVLPAAAAVAAPVAAVGEVVATVLDHAAAPVVDLASALTVPLVASVSESAAGVTASTVLAGIGQAAAEPDHFAGSDPAGGVQTLVGMVASADAFHVGSADTTPLPAVAVVDTLADEHGAAALLGLSADHHDVHHSDMDAHHGLGLGL